MDDIDNRVLNSKGTKILSDYHTGVSDYIRDYYYVRVNFPITTKYLYVLYEASLDYMWLSNGWNMETSSPIPLQTEYGPQAPLTVDAAEFDESSRRLYLIEGNTVYYFDVAGTPPTLSYSFLGTFDFRVNSGSNPFSAGPGSPMATPPAWVHALYISDDLVLTFAEDYKYVYDWSTKHWTKTTPITCPT